MSSLICGYKTLFQQLQVHSRIKTLTIVQAILYNERESNDAQIVIPLRWLGAQWYEHEVAHILD